jgi:hypothetical protein
MYLLYREICFHHIKKRAFLWKNEEKKKGILYPPPQKNLAYGHMNHIMPLIKCVVSLPFYNNICALPKRNLRWELKGPILTTYEILQW